MTRFVHDEFAKDYLEELLKPYGEVKSSSKISGEIKEIDVLFTPSVQQNSNLELLGLLGRFTEFPAILEPFRNAASSDEICDCIQKLLEVKALLRRDARANASKLLLITTKVKNQRKNQDFAFNYFLSPKAIA